MATNLIKPYGAALMVDEPGWPNGFLGPNPCPQVDHDEDGHRPTGPEGDRDRSRRPRRPVPVTGLQGGAQGERAHALDGTGGLRCRQCRHGVVPRPPAEERARPTSHLGDAAPSSGTRSSPGSSAPTTGVGGSAGSESSRRSSSNWPSPPLKLHDQSKPVSSELGADP